MGQTAVRNHMLISVNEAIDRLSELHGKSVEIYGTLSLDFETQCISHAPDSERRRNYKNNRFIEDSSIWIDFNSDATGNPDEAFRQYDRQKVVITGILSKPPPNYDGCGHFSQWPAEIGVAAIRRC